MKRDHYIYPLGPPKSLGDDCYEFETPLKGRIAIVPPSVPPNHWRDDCCVIETPLQRRVAILPPWSPQIIGG